MLILWDYHTLIEIKKMDLFLWFITFIMLLKKKKDYI